jgi:hypothetical protein
MPVLQLDAALLFEAIRILRHFDKTVFSHMWCQMCQGPAESHFIFYLSNYCHFLASLAMLKTSAEDSKDTKKPRPKTKTKKSHLSPKDPEKSTGLTSRT